MWGGRGAEPHARASAPEVLAALTPLFLFGTIYLEFEIVPFDGCGKPHKTMFGQLVRPCGRPNHVGWPPNQVFGAGVLN